MFSMRFRYTETKKHAKHKIWTDKPNYIVTYRGNDVPHHHFNRIRIKASNEKQAVLRAIILLSFEQEKFYCITEVKKYFKKKKKYQRPESLRKRYGRIVIPIYRNRNIAPLNLVGVQPLTESKTLTLGDYFYVERSNN